ncbi:MAG: terminase large subunit domain-containing protein [Promethearchaeota archaeon]
MIEEDIFYDEAAFFEFITGFKPYKYQVKFLRCKSKRIAVRSGRQVGKSLMAAVKALYRAFMYPKQQILIIAAYRQQANLVFSAIKECINNSEYIKDKIIRETLTQIHFDNGSVLYCLAAGLGKSIRGFSPDMIILDEAAFVPDKVWEAIEPMAAVKDATIILLSTPFGKTGFFYEKFKTDEYTKFHIRCRDCPAYKKEYLERMKKTKPQIIYQQEYEGEFVEVANNWFPLSLIKSCVVDGQEIDGAESGKVYILSVDFARFGNDESVFMVCEVGNYLKVVKIIATSKLPITDAIGRIKDLHSIFNFKKIYLDSSPLGAGAVDLLRSENLPIETCDFHLKNKAELYKDLKLLMEQKRVKYYNNQKLILQLANLKYEFSAMGTLKFYGEDNDDYCDALALATKALNFKSDEEEKDYFLS